jgi:CubicO group peptidase (beta-lactamase class C family)
MNTKNTATSLNRFLDLWLPERMNYGHIPGVSVGLVVDGELVAQKGYGFANVEKKVKATAGTNYRIASISKMFTAVAVLQLAEEKKLSIDDSVSSYLPWMKAKRGKRNAQDITIRQILTHTSGLWRDGEKNPFTMDKFPRRRNLQEVFSGEALTFAALEQFKYSNYAFALLGEVIREVSGMEYVRYVTEQIFQPLGMKNSFADFNGDVPNLATGYGRFIPGVNRDKFPQYTTNAYAPVAGVVSNVSDLAKFLAFLTSDEDIRILGKNPKKEMKRIQIKTGKGSDYYGLGVEVFEIGNNHFLGHTGGFQGFATQVLLNEETKIGIILLTNHINADVEDISLGIYKILTYMQLEGASKKRGLNMRALEGYYRGRWGDFVIVQAGNKLVARTTFEAFEDQVVSLVPIQGKEFRIENVSNYDSIGERARFTKEKGETLLWWGATPFVKIK